MKKTSLGAVSLILLGLGCATTPITPSKYFSKKGKANGFVSLWLPVSTPRAQTGYTHTLASFPRTRSDCKPICPKVDVWQYQYRPSAKLFTDKRPIATRKEHWKSADEARIIAISMFNGKKLYADAFFDYLRSFPHVKNVNGVNDPVWGYETFTVRVYVAKRNPKQLALLGPLQDDTPDELIEKFLAAGCEVAFVDNSLAKTGKDGTFWRFMIAGEEMPEGQRIRYLVRDADAILSAGEAFSVGEWMASGLAYHRMHLIPICLGPLTAFTWGGSHTGKGSFPDMQKMLDYFPYRFTYGDDELFTRDMVWPRIKATGSVMTHHYPRGVIFTIANPYKGSCEEPTQSFCDDMKPGGQCPDVLMPAEIQSPLKAMGLRGTFEELKSSSEYFDLHPESERGRRVIEALRAQGNSVMPAQAGI